MRFCIAKFGALWLTAVFLGACASQVPQTIRQAPANSPSLAQVRANIPDYLGREVRWGGAIIETGNRENSTRFIVLGRTLSKDGEPAISDASPGRFIASVPKFLDPEVYAPGRRITVTGTLRRVETGQVGEYPYTYPVLQTKSWYLWPLQTERYYDDYDPWWYDPWYPWPWWHDPWYPYGYPYHRHHHH